MDKDLFLNTVICKCGQTLIVECERMPTPRPIDRVAPTFAVDCPACQQWNHPELKGDRIVDIYTQTMPRLSLGSSLGRARGPEFGKGHEPHTYDVLGVPSGVGRIVKFEDGWTFDAPWGLSEGRSPDHIGALAAFQLDVDRRFGRRLHR